MALLISRIQTLLHRQSVAGIGLYALLALYLYIPITSAGDLEKLYITEMGGEYHLRIISVINAPADYVHEVITDYEHGYRINPSIIEAEILPNQRDGVVRVRNLSEHWVGPFCFKIDWVGDITEPRHGYLKVTTIPELSNFESGSATWVIRPRGEHTWLLHESRLKPDFFVPPLIGDNIMKNQMEKDTLATFKRIECHAMIMLERDLEHDTGQLRALLKEGKECTDPHG